MEEVEKHFKCPYCFEKISMLIDTSADGHQTYVEDCEVCCNPIQLDFDVLNSKIKLLRTQKAYG
jgi:hypothetical protein